MHTSGIKAASITAALAASAVFINLIKDGNGPLLDLGPVVWKGLTLIAAVLAAASPILGLDEKAARYEKAAMGYGIARDHIRSLLRDLKLEDLDSSHIARQHEIESVVSVLSALDDSCSKRTRESSWKQTLEEFPSDQAWNIV